MDTENNIENEPSDMPKKKEDQEEIKPAEKMKRQATEEQLNHPLHGVKLAQILERLVDRYGWEYLAERVKIRCFMYNPTMKASLGFLRKMAWAREHVEDLYMDMLQEGAKPKDTKDKQEKRYTKNT